MEWLEKVTEEQYSKENKKQALSAKQENIVTIAAFAAKGDLPQLKNALNTGLNAGLTVNEIKEILVQIYAYAGFPRSINGINTLMDVLEERGAKELRVRLGRLQALYLSTKAVSNLEQKFRQVYWSSSFG